MKNIQSKIASSDNTKGSIVSDEFGESTNHASCGHGCCCRREFLQTAGAAMGAAALLSTGEAAAEHNIPSQPRAKKTPRVSAAFLYVPSEQLKKEGYWSWPGSSFDAEGRQRTYAAKLEQAGRRLNVRIEIEPAPLADEASVSRFVDQVNRDRPDGLLLFVYKKTLHVLAERIFEAVKVPTLVCVPLGGLLARTIQDWQKRDGVHLLDPDQNFDSLLDGLRMVRAARWMKDARLVNIDGTKSREAVVPHLETEVRTIPHARFVEAYRAAETLPEVKRLADAYRLQAREIVEPSANDIREAARSCLALKHILKDEHGDALMMSCLQGIRNPRQHVPPCMGFMSLHDESVVAGCQSDLAATLTMMLGSQLLEKPGFMHNPSWNVAENLYFGAHCTCPSKLAGPGKPAFPYILRSHSEAGWGCVPQVLFPEDQPATLTHYFSGEKPRMIVHTGRVIRCYPKLPGGCRTNFTMKIDGVDNVDQAEPIAYLGHKVLFLGDHGKQLKAFCKLHGIEVFGA